MTNSDLTKVYFVVGYYRCLVFQDDAVASAALTRDGNALVDLGHGELLDDGAHVLLGGELEHVLDVLDAANEAAHHTNAAAQGRNLISSFGMPSMTSVPRLRSRPRYWLYGMPLASADSMDWCFDYRYRVSQMKWNTQTEVERVPTHLVGSILQQDSCDKCQRSSKAG